MDWFPAHIARRVDYGHGSRRGLLWLVVGLLLLAAGPARAEVLVTDVIFSPRSDGQGYVVRVRTTSSPEAYMLQPDEARELKWVLYNTTLHEDYEKRAPEGPIEDYTVTQQNGHLILRVSLAADRSVSPTAYRDGASDDLLLNLAYDDATPVATEAASSPASTASASSSSSEDEPTAPSAERRQRDPVAALSRERSRLDTVVIDPGHGGKDPGAVAHGLEEKDIVLDVAHKLEDYVENRLNLEVIYTRSDDRFIALEERGHLANRAGGDLFISLHANAFQSSSVQGTETYFLGRSKTDAARRVMKQENSVVREYEENPDRYDEYDAEAFVKGELFLSASMQFSEEFASIVQNQFKERVQRRSRGVHQAGFYVLWSASMPSVLVELGYLTNPQEARFLNSDRGQTYLASAIFRAVRKYKNQYNKGIVSSE
ncbi:N-acetylmuramoyl-L-alanine amidase family protein [Salinibacter grassmerensis]|uniref:N-acetylmuramoyl-L-alanine amidase family protein n=1 Tax=Salinibacter grassmerensis TaxID=3040353 RepID=UPI0021E8CD52|nr:N-acetylmuramoyl-L-alanine amidase [Salinibacter grassmerensis]